MTDGADISHCPRGHRCESCGTEHGSLAVVAIQTPLGIICLTLCPRCAYSEHPAPITLATTVRLVQQHDVHVKAAHGG